MQAATALSQFEIPSRKISLRQRISSLVLMLSVGTLIHVPQTTASAAEKAGDPNIIYILADDKN